MSFTVPMPRQLRPIHEIIAPVSEKHSKDVSADWTGEGTAPTTQKFYRDAPLRAQRATFGKKG